MIRKNDKRGLARITKMRRAANSRRAVAVITDGGDNHSQHSFNELLSAARESEVRVFAIVVRRNDRDLDETARPAPN